MNESSARRVDVLHDEIRDGLGGGEGYELRGDGSGPAADLLRQWLTTEQVVAGCVHLEADSALCGFFHTVGAVWCESCWSGHVRRRLRQVWCDACGVDESELTPTTLRVGPLILWARLCRSCGAQIHT